MLDISVATLRILGRQARQVRVLVPLSTACSKPYFVLNIIPFIIQYSTLYLLDNSMRFGIGGGILYCIYVPQILIYK